MNVADVLQDLIDEQTALDVVMAGLTPEQWQTDTASPRWTVADQIGHLTFFDNTAALAITDPEAFKESVAEMMSAGVGNPDPAAGDDYSLREFRALDSEGQLSAWRTNREVLAAAGRQLTNEDRVIWYGPSMGSKSFLTARLMEVWAHGQDICDAVGASRPASDRLRHIAQLGFITRGWTYINRGTEPPAEAVRVQLAAPSGETWKFGPDDATESVIGGAEDFCLVVTQRRHVDDTELQLTPGAARDWMVKAQCFAGPPSDGPAGG